MYDLIEEEFEGVVMIVTFNPWQLSAFERSSRGMVWPWDMKGKMTTWGLKAISKVLELNGVFLFFATFSSFFSPYVLPHEGRIRYVQKSRSYSRMKWDSLCKNLVSCLISLLHAGWGLWGLYKNTYCCKRREHMNYCMHKIIVLDMY